MGPAGVQRHLGKGQPLPGAQGPRAQPGVFGPRHLRGNHPHRARASVLEQRVLQRPLPGHGSLQNRQIALVLLVGREGRRQPRRRLGRAGQHHHPAHGPVQPVHQPQVDVPRLLIFISNITLHYAQQVVVPRAVRLNRQVRRLHHHQQVVVPVQHADDEPPRANTIDHMASSSNMILPFLSSESKW